MTHDQASELWFSLLGSLSPPKLGTKLPHWKAESPVCWGKGVGKVYVFNSYPSHHFSFATHLSVCYFLRQGGFMGPRKGFCKAVPRCVCWSSVDKHLIHENVQLKRNLLFPWSQQCFDQIYESRIHQSHCRQRPWTGLHTVYQKQGFASKSHLPFPVILAPIYVHFRPYAQAVYEKTSGMCKTGALFLLF